MEALVFAALFWITPIDPTEEERPEPSRAALLGTDSVPGNEEQQIVDLEAEFAELRERKAQLAAQLGVEFALQPTRPTQRLPS